MLFQNNEKYDLQRIPYSRAGSYYYLNEDYFLRKLKLIFIYAESMMHIGNVAFWLDMIADGKPVRYNYFGDEASLVLRTATQYVDMLLTDDNQVRFRGHKNAGFAITLASMDPNAPAFALKSAAMLQNGACELYFGQHGFIRFRALHGKMDIDCKRKENAAGYENFRVMCSPDGDEQFELVMDDYRTEFDENKSYLPFDELVLSNKQSFADFAENYRKVPDKYKKLAEDCIYEIWSHYMKPDAFVKSPMIMFQFICLTASFAWQQSYNGMAMQNNPQFGFELIMNLFQYQDERSGLLPANVNSGFINYAGAQPPMQGIALNLLVKQCGEDYIAPEVAEKLLPHFKAWIEYWTVYRTANRGKDVIAVNNPNECGWDDVSIFNGYFPASNADMQSLLAECMFSCEILARRAGKTEEEAYWRDRGNALVDTLIKDYWNGERFVTFVGDDAINSDSFVVYEPLILGKHLPQEIIDKCVEGLFEEGAFMTPMGMCSESMKSSYCTWGGAHFVAGRVVAPVQMFLSIGLWLCDKKEEARKIASAWCDTAAEIGVRLGFKPYEINPLTKEPAPAIIEPQPSDSWSWSSWSACCTMTMLQTILTENMRCDHE